MYGYINLHEILFLQVKLMAKRQAGFYQHNYYSLLFKLFYCFIFVHIYIYTHVYTYYITMLFYYLHVATIQS